MTLKNICLFIFLFILIGCGKDDDDNLDIDERGLEIEDFIWRGLNLYYYWQEDVNNLADDRFNNNKKYIDFLAAAESPEDLFQSLLYTNDRFSYLIDDVNENENSLVGISKTSGVEYGLVLLSDRNSLFGYVRYVLADSDAEAKGIKRGDIFLEVDDTPLTINNYRDLLSSSKNTYSLSMGDLVGNELFLNGKEITLVTAVIQENPIFISKVIELQQNKVGYLMYNGFNSDFENELEQVFRDFSNTGIDNLVLDLRYNLGGRVDTAIKLASLITGQFSGEIFARSEHNNKIKSALDRDYPFDNLSVGLRLPKLYILTTSSTASASELIINGLNPFIDIIQIGDTTYGKNVGSFMVKDWIDDDFDEINPNHTYAMQPITSKIENSVGFSDFENGLNPDIELLEDLSNLGILGEVTEPLLERALQHMNLLPIKAIQPPTDNIPFFINEQLDLKPSRSILPLPK